MRLCRERIPTVMHEEPKQITSYERIKTMNKTIKTLAIAALFVFPGLSGFPQEVQQDETPAAKPVVEENVAVYPGWSGFP